MKGLLNADVAVELNSPVQLDDQFRPGLKTGALYLKN
jgi:hypothetical protein